MADIERTVADVSNASTGEWRQFKPGRLAGGCDFLTVLAKAGVIPETARSVTIHADFDGVVSINCEWLPKIDGIGELAAKGLSNGS